MDLIDRIFRRSKTRRFGAWQIELTTRCPLQCRMCVKESCADWLRTTMGQEDFLTLLPYLKDVGHVVLEGWGESLLHPDLPELVRLVREQGCTTGFVTSGMGLTEELAGSLTASGVDFMGFSLSGATARTHNFIRTGSDFDEVLHGATLMARAPGPRGGPGPKLHIVYLLLKSNVAELPLLPGLAASLGIGEIILINITQVSTSWQKEEQAFSYHGPEPYQETFREMEQAARALKIRVTRPGLVPREVALCSENPLSNLYISSQGEVSPCVYLNPPVHSPFIRLFKDKEFPVGRVTFGNIFREPFGEIWAKEGYRRFRRSFEDRLERSREVYRSLLEMKRPGESGFPDPPEPCMSCHKMLGF